MSDAILIEVDSGSAERHAVAAESVIGREGCEVTLADQEVSRRHAAIRSVEGGLGIEDLESRNGTFVNDERIDGIRALRDGDQVRVGDTVLRFELVQDSAPSASPAAPGGGASRGDVPAPEVVPSVVRRAPPLDAAAPPAFTKAGPRKIRGSAARRVEATIVAYAVVIVTAVAVIAYLAAR